MLLDARAVLSLLRLDVNPALAAQDFWYLITAGCLVEASFDEAPMTVLALETRLGLTLKDARVLDVGCGVGRHLASLAAYGATDIVGIDTSARLVAIAQQTAPVNCRVVELDCLDASSLGSFDIITVFAHSLFGSGDRRSHVARLRAVRAALSSNGSLVLELMSAAPSTGTTVWTQADGYAVNEEFANAEECGPMVINRKFTFTTTSETLTMYGRSTHYSMSELAALAGESGFALAEAHPLANENQLVRFRPKHPFNYLSDLPTYLEAWDDPSHPRNSLDIELIHDSHGRVRPPAPIAFGGGVSLSRHHTKFLESIELEIRPLVEALVFEWNLITYSSCGGHDHSEKGGLSAGYCGIVALSDEQRVAVETLLNVAILNSGGEIVDPQLRHRVLMGPNEGVDVIDLVFVPMKRPAEWSEYRDGFRRAISTVVSHLTKLAADVRQPCAERCP
jgi:SAM-dependent methyltransferase